MGLQGPEQLAALWQRADKPDLTPPGPGATAGEEAAKDQKRSRLEATGLPHSQFLTPAQLEGIGVVTAFPPMAGSLRSGPSAGRLGRRMDSRFEIPDFFPDLFPVLLLGLLLGLPVGRNGLGQSPGLLISVAEVFEDDRIIWH